MGRKRHWTVYAIVIVVSITICGVGFFIVKMRKLTRFEDSITEAGGVVHFDHSALFGGSTFSVSTMKPVEAEISSGSHPIPDLRPLNWESSIKTLSLNTNNAGDHLVPMLSSLRHIEILNLTDSEMTTEAVLQLLESMPKLKELHLTANNFSQSDRVKLKANHYARKLIF